MKNNIYIISNACEKRGLDSTRIENYFRFNKCNIVKDCKIADYIIFVTCSFKELKKDECFKIIDDLSRYRAELLVFGCLPDIALEEFKDKFKGRFIGTKDLGLIDNLFPTFKTKFNEIPDQNLLINRHKLIYKKQFFRLPKIFLSHFRLSLNFLRKIKHFLIKETASFCEQFLRNKAYLRISNGCIENCAYCCIRRAVGQLRSKSLEVCRNEYVSLLKAGYREFIIIADNLGAYGFDIKSSLPDLLSYLDFVSKGVKVRWRLSDLDPKWLIRYKIELFAFIKARKINLIICPVQSGSSRILKLMNRYFDVEKVIETLIESKEINPSLRLETQIIVGFPSESEEDFDQTINLIKKVRFDEVLIFPYFDGCKTLSSSMDNKVSQDIIDKRIRKLISILERENIFWLYDERDWKELSMAD
ncbi:MAG: radical SAM protein [Candidatus Omnitrophica bacterium]|nr:radical SAM protein [Candidatus Omnitrophota bacterium]